MKIYMMSNNLDNGCYWVRNYLPAEALKKIGHYVRIDNKITKHTYKYIGSGHLDTEPIDWCDVFVLVRHYDQPIDIIEQLVDYAKEQGKLVVYETDDLIQSIEESNPMYKAVKKNEEKVVQMIKMADVCTTTTEKIANQIRKYNKNVVVLPNCVDPKLWKKRKGGNKRVLVGWQGSSSHIADLLEVIDPIIELQKEIEFDFVIFGLAPLQWSEYIEHLKIKHSLSLQENPNAKPAEWFSKTMELDEKLKELRWFHQPFVGIKEFSAKLSELNFDIGICPITETDFNEGRSAIKFYEYAMVGTVTLASKVGSYIEECLTVKNRHTKWKSSLRRLIEDKKLRKETLKEQGEWVLKNRTIDNKVKDWEKVYKNI